MRTWPNFNDNSFIGACCAHYNAIKDKHSLSEAKDHVNNLIARGCKICGNDPIQPGADIGDGAFSVDWTPSPKCPLNGICEPPIPIR